MGEEQHRCGQGVRSVPRVWGCPGCKVGLFQQLRQLHLSESQPPLSAAMTGFAGEAAGISHLRSLIVCNSNPISTVASPSNNAQNVRRMLFQPGSFFSYEPSEPMDDGTTDLKFDETHGFESNSSPSFDSNTDSERYPDMLSESDFNSSLGFDFSFNSNADIQFSYPYHSSFGFDFDSDPYFNIHPYSHFEAYCGFDLNLNRSSDRRSSSDFLVESSSTYYDVDDDDLSVDSYS